MKTIKLILIDDHSMILEGLESFFTNRSDIKIIAKLTNVAQVKNFCDSYSPSNDDISVALCDLSFKEKQQCDEKEVGFEIVKILNDSNKNIKCIIYSMHNSASYVQYALSAKIGAVGYLLKDADKNCIFEAVDTVANGKIYLQNEVSINFIKTQSIVQTLTNREKTIAEYIAMDFSTEEIADKLFISKRTVENYITHLYDKTGTKTRDELIKILNGNWKNI